VDERGVVLRRDDERGIAAVSRWVFERRSHRI
jgi:hypothetical protein